VFHSPARSLSSTYILSSPLFVVAYVYTLPESPRWLLMRARQGNPKKYEEAFTSLCKLRHTKLQAGRDLFLIDHLLEAEEHIMQQEKPFSELFTRGRNRRALTASVITMFLQQFCGVNVTVGYFRCCLSTHTSRRFSATTNSPVYTCPTPYMCCHYQL